MRLRIVRLTALGLSLALSTISAADPKRLDLCEVAGNLEPYIGQQVNAHGVVISMEHGIYLMPFPKCDDGIDGGISIKDVDFAGYRAAGGSKGRGVIATVQGKIVMFSTTYRGKKVMYPVLSADMIKWVAPAY